MKIEWWHLFILFMIAILFNFPSQKPRYYAFIIIMIFFVYFIMKKEKKSFSFYYLLLMGIFMSSFFELFRFLSRKVSNFRFNFEYFYVGHFDSYENFLYTYNYVYEQGISYGYNLLGTLFFFIPRSIWTTKPVGSGYFLAEHYIEGARNLNVANSSIAEFYFNFNIFGILIFSLFYGVISAILDRSARDFIHGKENSIESKLYIIFYSFAIGILLFNLRGDMLSSYSSGIGIFLSLLLINYIFGYKFILKKEY